MPLYIEQEFNATFRNRFIANIYFSSFFTAGKPARNADNILLLYRENYFNQKNGWYHKDLYFDVFILKNYMQDRVQIKKIIGNFGFFFCNFGFCL